MAASILKLAGELGATSSPLLPGLRRFSAPAAALADQMISYVQ